VEMCGDGWKTENGLFSIYAPVITVNLASDPRTMNIPLVARYHYPLSHYCSFGAVFALISFTFLATGPEITTASVIWAMHYLSQPENGHIQSHLPAEIHITFPSRLPTPPYRTRSPARSISRITSDVLRPCPPIGVKVCSAARGTSQNGGFEPSSFATN